MRPPLHKRNSGNWPQCFDGCLTALDWCWPEQGTGTPGRLLAEASYHNETGRPADHVKPSRRKSAQTDHSHPADPAEESAPRVEQDVIGVEHTRKLIQVLALDRCGTKGDWTLTFASLGIWRTNESDSLAWRSTSNRSSSEPNDGGSGDTRTRGRPSWRQEPGARSDARARRQRAVAHRHQANRIATVEGTTR